MTQLAIPAVHPGLVVGGYSLVRRLGEGVTASVFLGVAGTPDAPLTAAVKVYRAGGRAGDREVEALGRVTHPHALALRDIATAPGGSVCLLLERLELGSLATLLAERSTIAAGEAVTILVPVAEALDTIHASGVAHGAISAGRVLFRATGAPVLAGFSHCSLFEPDLTPAELAERVDVRADRAALCALVRVVLGRVDAGVEPLLQWLDAVQAEGYPDALGGPLGDRLFELADALPVRFATDAPSSAAVPSRAVPTAASEPETAARSTLLASIALPPWLDAMREKLTGSVGSVRRPLWWVFAAVAVALLAALVLVPDGEAERSGSPSPPTETEIPVDTVPTGPVTGDDPVAAVVVLLDLRERCLRDLSVLCLDDVLEPGSSALDRDAALIRAIQDGGETSDALALTSPQPSLVERLGDSALVSLGADSKPASVLLMKGEAGWRIRGYVDGADE